MDKECKKLLSLDWLKQFHCAGGSCPLTCCEGWKILITEKEIEMYKKMSHPLKTEILSAVDENNKCMNMIDDKCSLLTEDGWCRIVQQCGEKYLSFTCATFPRAIHTYGDTVEACVEIVCPVVAGYLMKPEKITFSLTDLEGDVTEHIDYQLYDALSLARTFLIELFQSYDEQYNTGKCYILFNTINMVNELYRQGCLQKEYISSKLLPYNLKENCMEIFQAGEQIADSLELKAERFYDIIRKLAENDCLNLLLCDLSDIIVLQHISSWLNNLEQLRNDMGQFLDYFRENYLYMAENYFVYILFLNWIPHPILMDNFGKKIKMRIVEFGLIQLAAMSVWKQKREVSEKEYGIIIAGIDRGLAHNKLSADRVIRMLVEEDSIAKILLLLLC